jgi:dipeptidyl aminopeptidase/acylaminoacyl peptidase
LPRDGPLDGYVFDPSTHRLVGVRLEGDRDRQQFYEPILQRKQAAFGKALGSVPVIETWSADFSMLVLYTSGNGDAGTYWLADGPSVKPIAYAHPDIPDAAVGPSRVVVYHAADGLELHGILTLPPGEAPVGLPVVVIAHGGPESHDTLDFDYRAQAFANLGYAVFRPNFRGSNGYGLAFRDRGMGEWGRKMQTDVSDGLAEIAREGIVDPKRACIFGGGYGGYVALAGVTLQHDLYRCAVSVGGISDLPEFMDWVAPRAYAESDDRNPRVRYLRRMMGVKANDDRALAQLSPALHAAEASAPVLIIHSRDDTSVPIDQTRKMEHELEHAGKTVEVLILPGTDDDLARTEARSAVLTAAVAFVTKMNPADAAPTAEAARRD